MNKDTVNIISSQVGKGKESLSLKALKWAATQNLGMRDYAALCAMIRYMDKHYTCYPNMKTLAADIGCGERTVRNAIESLSAKAKGLITVTKKRTTHGHEKNHYRLNVDKPPAGDATGRSGHRQDMHKPPANGAEPPAGGAAGHRQELPIKEASIEGSQGKEANEGIAGKPQNHGYASQDQNPEQEISSGELAAIWKTELAEHHDGASFLPGKQEIGQLRNLLALLGEDTVPVVRHVIRNWQDFIDEAKDREGAFSCPSVPAVGFLLKYRSTAFDLYMAEVKAAEQSAKWKAAAKAKQAEMKPVGITAPPPTRKSVAKEKPATLEDFLKIKAEIEAEAAKKEG